MPCSRLVERTDDADDDPCAARGDAARATKHARNGGGLDLDHVVLDTTLCSAGYGGSPRARRTDPRAARCPRAGWRRAISSPSTSVRACRPPASPTASPPPQVTSARRHPQLLPPRGSGRGPAFSCPAAPRRYLQLEYLYGTGDGQLGGRRTGDGRCSGAVGGVVESAASARRVARVMVYVHVGRCLKSGSALFFAAAVRRTNVL